VSETLQFRLVDAFAEGLYRGNRAGVVLDADGLEDGQLQLIAAEIGASETAFISRLSDLHRPPRLRWFTPSVEVGFCGHATIAAAQAMYESGLLVKTMARSEPSLAVDSRAGELVLYPEVLPEPDSRPMWWLEMPDPGLKPDNTNPVKMCELLGVTEPQLDASIPPMRTRDDDVIYLVDGVQTLFELQPRFEALGAWCRRVGIRGVCVATTATLSDSIDVQSRFFAPAVGVDEDPVTGSVHGPLAVLLVVNGLVGSAAGRSGLNCAQGRPGERSGLVRALVNATARGYRVRIGGLCFTTLRGELEPPPAV
jgi:PhzF family phenazine biosynthesis protein